MRIAHKVLFIFRNPNKYKLWMRWSRKANEGFKWLWRKCFIRQRRLHPYADVLLHPSYTHTIEPHFVESTQKKIHFVVSLEYIDFQKLKTMLGMAVIRWIISFHRNMKFRLKIKIILIHVYFNNWFNSALREMLQSH